MGLSGWWSAKDAILKGLVDPSERQVGSGEEDRRGVPHPGCFLHGIVSLREMITIAGDDETLTLTFGIFEGVAAYLAHHLPARLGEALTASLPEMLASRAMRSRGGQHQTATTTGVPLDPMALTAF
jgi:hypothetical protein